MFKAFITYMGMLSQSAEGMSSRDEAASWIGAKLYELAQTGTLCADHGFYIVEPQPFEIWADLTRV